MRNKVGAAVDFPGKILCRIGTQKIVEIALKEDVNHKKRHSRLTSKNCYEVYNRYIIALVYHKDRINKVKFFEEKGRIR